RSPGRLSARRPGEWDAFAHGRRRRERRTVGRRAAALPEFPSAATSLSGGDRPLGPRRGRLPGPRRALVRAGLWQRAVPLVLRRLGPGLAFALGAREQGARRVQARAA